MTNSLILASTSIYKKMLLERLRINFTCVSPNTNEQPLDNETPKSLAIRLANEKALAVATKNPEAVVIGADQVGELNGKVLGKPKTFDKTVEQISNQSGQTVYFHSAISVVKKQKNGKIKQKASTNTTKVTFKQLTQQQIELYIRAEEPYDCAGGFKSEGLGISLFSSIESNDPTSLIGLPLIDLCSILEIYDITIPNI
jgi:septum formation protein